ncbi:MAG: acylphosphatase [Firmicutes bacterium]|nr:acylphosphatase [Bacillota bacterium]
MARKHLYISGRVQGVCFRAYTREVAESLGIRGWVRNLPDGRVEAVIEGDHSAVEKMLEWCRTGTPPAQVKRVEVIEENSRVALGDFRIIR